MIIAMGRVKDVSSSVKVPKKLEIANKNAEELRNLRIKKVEWCGIFTLGFTLSDGQSCEAGNPEFSQWHNFDPTKQITKVECIIDK